MEEIKASVQPTWVAKAGHSSGKTLLTIQALRALAAVMVVVHHLLTVVKENSPFPRGPQWMGGSTGVDIFFVISGLVMTTSSSWPHANMRLGPFCSIGSNA